MTTFAPTSRRGESPCRQCRAHGECQQPGEVWSAYIRQHHKCKTTNLDTRLASKSALEVHHLAADLVAHRRLALVVGGGHALRAPGSSGTVGAGAMSSTLGGKRALASVAVVTNATGVRCGLPGSGCGASNWVGGSRFCHASGLSGLLAGKTGEETGLAASSGSGSCASASHCVGSYVVVCV